MKLIDDYRQQIDTVDTELLKLFIERMEISRKIGAYKKEHGIAVLDSIREKEILTKVDEKAGKDMRPYSQVLFSTLFDLSRTYQESALPPESTLCKIITDTLVDNDQNFPQYATIACQESESQYANIACDRIFTEHSIQSVAGLDKIISSVSKGLCRYGLLQVINGYPDSIARIYGLLSRFDLKIVRSTRLNIGLSLAVKLSTIKYEDFIDYFKQPSKDITNTAASNTDDAAKIISETNGEDVAAITSNSFGNNHWLECIESSVQDKDTPYARFICFSKNLEIYPGANRSSFMLIVPQRAMYHILGRLHASGINIINLECHSMLYRETLNRCYFDLEISPYSNDFIRLISYLENICDEFHYLGSYLEIT